MTDARTTKPWEKLARLITESDAERIRQWIDELEPGETVRAVSLLDDETRLQLLGMLEPGDAADVLETLPEPQAVDAMEDLEPATAAKIMEEMPSDDRADLFCEMDTTEAEAILAEMPESTAAAVRELAAYPEDVAGGLMVTEYLAFRATATVAKVMRSLERGAERYAEYDVQYLYVTDDQAKLVGVLPLRRLVLASASARIGDLMIKSPVSIRDDAPITEVAAIFDEYDFFGVPVTSEAGSLVGVVRRAGLEEALAEEAEETYRQAQGIVGGEELRTMPLIVRSRRRLAWLSINILLNVIAASVIAMHQDTLQAVIALAVFLPIISDMSGCSGSQAVAVSMRELSLGVTRPTDLARVLGKELSVGLVNGIALGIIIGVVGYVWKGNLVLGAVVGGALAVNTMVAVAIGGSVPLILKRFKMDPALASGPILTTITDMCGFFLVLTLASLALPMLT